jgi:hypothetical protein
MLENPQVTFRVSAAIQIPTESFFFSSRFRPLYEIRASFPHFTDE